MKYSLSFLKALSNEFVNYNAKDLENMYLQYFNDFLTIDKFAEYNNFTRYEASKIIDLGKKINNSK